MKKIRDDYEEANRKIEALESFREKYETAQKEISDRDEQIKELENSLAALEEEIKHVKAEAANLEKKYKTDSKDKEHMVIQ